MLMLLSKLVGQCARVRKTTLHLPHKILPSRLSFNYIPRVSALPFIFCTENRLFRKTWTISAVVVALVRDETAP